MANVGTLTVAIDADVEGLRNGLDSAMALVDQAARRMEAAFAPASWPEWRAGDSEETRQETMTVAAQRRIRRGAEPVFLAANSSLWPPCTMRKGSSACLEPLCYR
jgi:hypothetical protein